MSVDERSAVSELLRTRASAAWLWKHSKLLYVPRPPSHLTAQRQLLVSYFVTGYRSVLLGTAVIDICHLGSNFKARALIGSGSEATFISERLFKLIKLPHQVLRAQISGLNQTVSAESKKLCQFTIRSPTRPCLQISTTAYALWGLWPVFGIN